MSRQDKLFSRLDTLESEWKKMILSELEKVSDEGNSKYITRYMGHYASPAYSDDKTDEIERLEKEIHKLRKKLSLPIDASPKAILDEYVARYRSGEGNARGISRKMLQDHHVA
jgi:hypothetical protein